MNHFNPGLISTYNSLTDKHLAGYFSNTRIRRHLQRAGLITRSGRIVPDKEYRLKLIQRAHQRHVRECLAQAIFHKVLEMERLHQIEIKKKLEDFARREKVHKIKVERPKRCEEDIIRILSPHPPVGARSIQKQHSGPEGEHSESSESPSSSRPNTAPGKMQRPVRLKPIHSNSTTASVRRSSPYRHHETSQDSDQPFNRTMNKEPRRRLTTKEASHGISPYLLPVINNFVTPVPPATKRKERRAKITPNSTFRGRRLLPTTASSSADVTEDPPWLRSSVHQSRVCVNMVYFGKTVHLFHDMNYMRDEVKVFQQHCGGENLCVYKGRLCEGESFQFISRRHRGFPFSLTFFLNGLQVERLSSCCEFKHRKGSRLGGRLGHFGFSSVEGASPCYKCIIAMGLDKKPTPPPKRLKEDRTREESATSSKNSPEMETEKTAGDVASASESETKQAHDTETQVKEKTAPEEDKVRDDYEEDFEADDEGPIEEAKEEKSPSPSSETEMQVPDKDSETDDDEKEDVKSRSGSSLSASDQEENEAEATKDCEADENQLQGDDQEEVAASTDDKDKPNPEETAATEIESTLAKDSDIHNSAGDSTEIEISTTSIPSGAENKQSVITSGDQNDEKPVESKNEEEQERAKSVQEKLAEAILKESQCSSEPELSDTSTEEEEEPTNKGSKQNNKDENTSSEQQQTLVEESKCDEMIADEMAQKQEELSEAENRIDAEQELHDSSGSTKDQKASEVEEDEKADETTAEGCKSEEPGESQLPINEENVSQDDKSADPLKEAKSADVDTAENDEDSDEKTAVETEILPNESGRGEKSREEDESSALEPSKKTDETAVPDIAEVEAMTASETMEIKAESSEEREALSCEEAPGTDAERRQEADSEDGAAASQTEVTPEYSSSLQGEGEDIMAEKTAEENIKDETSKDDIKEEEEAGQISGAEVGKDNSQQEKCEPEEERINKSVEVDEETEKQESEKDAQEEEKQANINSDEMAEYENTNKTEEEEGKDKNQVDESAYEEQNIAEGTENDTNTEEEEKEKEEAEKTLNEEDKAVNEEKVEEPEKIEEDENNHDENHEAKEKSETKTAEEEKDDGAEIPEKGEYEDKDAETKNYEECQEKKDVTEKTAGEKEETSEITEKHEEVDLDNMKLCPENIVESEYVGGSEATDEKNPAEETINETVAEIVRGSSEKGEIDAENGEIYGEAEEAGVESEKTDLKAAEQAAEEPTEDESTVESGNAEDDRVDTIEEETKEGNDGVTKLDESAKNDPEPEISDLESKENKLEERKVNEETEQDENKSDLDKKNSESDSMENNNNTENPGVVAPSEDQEQSLDVGFSSSQSFQEKHESKTETHPHTEESAAGADLSAADGDNGADTEEASKASEEGASVLLKPQAQNKEEDEKQSIAVGGETPEALEKEDNTDMVTNWINMHQTSKFFETFIEPLDDLEEKVPNTQISNSNIKETELQRSQSPVKLVLGDEEETHKLKDENESSDKTQTEAVESDLNSMPAAGDHDENDPKVEGLEETTEVKGLIPSEETDQGDRESGKETEKPQENKERRESCEEDNAQDEPTQGAHEKNAFSKTEVESFSGSLKPESILENASSSGANMDVHQTETDLSFKTEEDNEEKSQDGKKDGSETADKKSQGVTQINESTASKSDDGSQEESHAEEIQPKPSEETFSGERRDVQLIQDIKHALGKDRLSTFSVDEKLFSHSSYPLLTAATTESGH